MVLFFAPDFCIAQYMNQGNETGKNSNQATYKQQQKLPLGLALTALLLSTLLFVLNNGAWQLAANYGLSRNGVYAVGHLLAAFGLGVLLWGVTKVIERSDRERNRILRIAVIAVTLFHVVAALAYIFSFGYNLYTIATFFWGLRLLAGFFVGFNFFTFEDTRLRIAAVLLLVFIVTMTPFSFVTGFWFFVQWIVGKIAIIWLAFLLYRCAQSRHFGNMKEIK